MPPEPIPPVLDLGLAGSLAVVTGGAHGIGLAITRRLVSVGARVIVVDKDEESLRAMTTEAITPVVADMSSGGTAELADELVHQHGAITLVVNNVGVTTPHHFLQLEESEYDLVFDTNLRGPWFFTRQLALRLAADRTSGSILFVSSVHERHVRLNPHYSASKAAVAMLVKEMALELAPHRIRVNSVSPGWIKTADVSEVVEGRLLARIPTGRPGAPDDVARLAIVLLSDRWSGYVTGADLTIDGGLSLHNWLMDS